MQHLRGLLSEFNVALTSLSKPFAASRRLFCDGRGLRGVCGSRPLRLELRQQQTATMEVCRAQVLSDIHHTDMITVL